MPTDATVPPVGKKAPTFTATSHTGEKVRLSQFKGRYVVLYFYPKDNTPGCTVEAREFRDAHEDFLAANAVVLGVSPDSAASHCKFMERFELNFTLLADESHALAEAYGVWVEKSMYGKTFEGIQRSTFLIGPDGTLIQAWPKVKAEGHAGQVLKYLSGLQH
ncbi:MAG: thioredoxin-dependent thiol peroxidase [Candidatus Hydrogenedentes bacterium]|nr:thioredoxin-dependent thiol peroxidase [Candidatus Hydrogenedentota bacterium]